MYTVRMKRFVFAICVVIGLCGAIRAHAADIFSATVTDIEQSNEEGVVNQTLILESETGERFEIDLYADLEIIDQGSYEVGEKLYIRSDTNPEGDLEYRIADRVRLSGIAWLTALFFASVIAVSGWKGVKSLFVLLLTFLIILNFIIPRIVAGNDPVLISVLGGVFIVGLSVFITEGWNKKSKVAFVSIMITLLFVLAMTAVFPELAKLTGLGSEEALALSGLDGMHMNMRGLVLAGMIIVSLGVIDDLILTQVSVVDELCVDARACYNKNELFKRAMSVGQSHVGAMINTLFFAYAGAALPLLVVFSTGVAGDITFLQAVNMEFIAIEIVRTLIGSIAMVCAVPIATWVAVKRYTEG